MTAADDLDRRLTLEAPVETDDGAGGVSLSYESVATLWALVVPLGVRADVSADSLGGASRYRIVIRKRDDVTTRHRFREGETIYRILALSESADRRFTDISVERRED
jgi:SPP1 family predicted phage head-tail adaptor